MMQAPHGETITIIGGGASGVLLAAHLLRQPDTDVRVILIERSGVVGKGLAYSTERLSHRVNVPARGMSAYTDDPQHFLRWLQRADPGATPWTFAARSSYGAYLRHVLAEAAGDSTGRLTILSEEAVSLRETASGVETILANGTSIVSHQAVLAVGHETNPARGRGIAIRVGSNADTPLEPYARIMILGSGLSMVDTWIELAESDHRGPVIVVSRNGLLPKAHRQVDPISIDAADVPFGTNLVYCMRWLRQLIAERTAQGEDWRSVIDGLRPYSQKLWQSWSRHTRRQFLRHARPWWNIHRHRIPSDLHEAMLEAKRKGQITLIAGEFLNVRKTDGGIQATIRRRGLAEPEILEVDRIYDCGGVSVDVTNSSNPLVASLVAGGHAHADDLHIGLDVNDHFQLLAADGSPSPRIHVVGPLTRGQFFEIEAIPDIRNQCREIASLLQSLRIS